MPRTRQYRRHKRAVKLARRYRIVLEAHRWNSRDDEWAIPDPRWRHLHLRCNCFAEPKSLRRRREERAWRADQLGC